MCIGARASTTHHQPTMKALYITDEIDTCDCCGRTDLKATVAMKLTDGEILHYGRTCAARNSGKTQKQIKQEVFQEAAAAIGRASWEYRTSDECRSLRAFMATAASKAKGWMSGHEAALREACTAKKKLIAARHGVKYGSF
jgi:hypothetical protein